MSSAIATPSPGPLDNATQLSVTTLGSQNELDKNDTKTLGHQGVKNTGGKNPNMRVLHCTNVSKLTDYQMLHDTMKPFGSIERMKMKLAENQASYDAYITYIDSLSAYQANADINGKGIGGSTCSTKIMSSLNIQDELYDFVPNMNECDPTEKIAISRF